MTEGYAVSAALFTLALLIFAAGLALGALSQRRISGYQPKASGPQGPPPPGGTAVVPPRPAWIAGLQPVPGTAGYTIAAALNGIGCLGRSRPDEPVFVLCARDKAASMTVRDWAALAEKLGANPEKTFGARAIADHMEQWRDNNGGGKIPD